MERPDAIPRLHAAGSDGGHLLIRRFSSCAKRRRFWSYLLDPGAINLISRANDFKRPPYNEFLNS